MHGAPDVQNGKKNMNLKRENKENIEGQNHTENMRQTKYEDENRRRLRNATENKCLTR